MGETPNNFQLLELTIAFGYSRSQLNTALIKSLKKNPRKAGIINKAYSALTNRYACCYHVLEISISNFTERYNNLSPKVVNSLISIYDQLDDIDSESKRGVFREEVQLRITESYKAIEENFLFSKESDHINTMIMHLLKIPYLERVLKVLEGQYT